MTEARTTGATTAADMAQERIKALEGMIALRNAEIALLRGRIEGIMEGLQTMRQTGQWPYAPKPQEQWPLAPSVYRGR